MGYNNNKTEKVRITMKMLKIKKLILLTLAVIISIGALTVNANALTSKAEWDAAYNKYYSTKTPWQSIDGAANDTQVWFSWHAHYWLRAYVSMARTFGDAKYMDQAVGLIDHMFYYTDEARVARREIDLNATPYDNAPLQFLLNPGTPAPGWRIWVGGLNEWRNQTLDDGMITQAIMRFVELVKSDPVKWSAYTNKADLYLSRCENIASQHDSVYAAYRFTNIDGSYYYPRPDGTGLYSGAVPLNHSATMAVTLILIDKVKPGGAPAFRKKAEEILGYFKNSLTLKSNNSYTWYYKPHSPGAQEDFNHGHIDLDFLVAAYENGLNISAAEMTRFANTYTKNLYKGNAEVAWTVDGLTANTSGNYVPAGFGWIDLTRFDPQVLEISKDVYNAHAPNPSWARDMLGWAEILRWSNAASAPQAPKALRIVQ